MAMYTIENFYDDISVLANNSSLINAGGTAMKSNVAKELNSNLILLDKIASFMTKPELSLNFDTVEVRPHGRGVSEYKTVTECVELIQNNLKKALAKGWIPAKEQNRIEKDLKILFEQLKIEKNEIKRRPKLI